jgi:hypothetical protein
MCQKIRFASVCTALCAAVWIVPDSAGAAADESVSGRVTDVTLYDGQAMVTRTIPVDATKGSVEIVAGDLPEQLLPDSLFAEGSEEVEIRAVRFRSRSAIASTKRTSRTAVPPT